MDYQSQSTTTETSSPYYPQRRRHNPTPWVIGICVGLVVLLSIFCIVGIFTSTGDLTFDPPSESYIGVLHIEGTIASTTSAGLLYSGEGLYSQDYVLGAIENMKEDENNKAILLYINTPGGEMYAGDDVYQALLDYKEETGRKIYAYFAQTAASGGYYIGMAADEIYAHRMTLTGSIGVTYGSHIDLSGLCEKLGVKVTDITSGDNKAMGSYFSPLTEEQIAIYQSQLEEYQGYFVEVVMDGRGLDEQTVRDIADGRTFTAKQALELDLIDGIMEYEAYKADIEEDFEEEVVFFDYSFEMEYEDMLAELGYIKTDSASPASEIEAVLAVIKPLNGILMYYSGN